MNFESEIKRVLSPLTWEKSNNKIYFTIACDIAESHVLNGSIETLENSGISIADVQKIIQNLPNLIIQSKQLISENHPENDCQNLPFSEIMIQKNGEFMLGFDTGDSPAGNLFIFVQYDKDFQQNSELIYEVY